MEQWDFRRLKADPNASVTHSTLTWVDQPIRGWNNPSGTLKHGELILSSIPMMPSPTQLVQALVRQANLEMAVSSSIFQDLFLFSSRLNPPHIAGDLATHR